MNGPMAMPGNSPIFALERKLSEGWLPYGYIGGLTLSNNTDDATNDINIAQGVARSTSNRHNGVISTHSNDQRDIELSETTIKQLDVVWAPGNGGGRSAESLANGSWHWLAAGGRGLKDSVIALKDISTPTIIHNALPSGYTAYRRLGSVIRSTSIRPFIQFGDQFTLKTPVLDVNNATPTTSAVVVTMASLPSGFRVEGHFNTNASISGAGVYLSCPDAVDMQASATAAPLATQYAGAWASNAQFGVQAKCLTNTSGQIRYRLTANVQISIATLGWRDLREKEGPL